MRSNVRWLTAGLAIWSLAFSLFAPLSALAAETPVQEGTTQRWLDGLFRSGNSGNEIPHQKNSAAVRAVFREAVAPVADSVVRVLSNDKQLALGTVVDADGYILTKASELRGRLTCEFRGGRRIDAELVGVAEDHDIALLHVDTQGLTPIAWQEEVPPVGAWVASAGSRPDPVSVGVVSVAARKIAPQAGFLGIIFAEGEEGTRINEVIPGSGAEKAGLKIGDIIRNVNGKDVKNRVQLTETIRTYKPGHTVELKIKRGDKDLDIEARIGVRPDGPIADKKDIQNSMGGPLSERRVGFVSVLQHDTVLKPQEVGGPLVDLDGKVVGINIARAGRVMSFAVPATIVQPLIAELRSGKYPVPESMTALKSRPTLTAEAEKLTQLRVALRTAEEAKRLAEEAFAAASEAFKKAEEARDSANDDLKRAEAAKREAESRRREAAEQVETLKRELSQMNDAQE